MPYLDTFSEAIDVFELSTDVAHYSAGPVALALALATLAWIDELHTGAKESSGLRVG